MTMNIRKIAVVGSFAAGAALAFAPLAAADPVDITSTIDSEIASMNSMFEFDTLLAGVSGDVDKGGVGVFDTIKPEDIGTVQDNGTTPFDYLIYGLTPNLAGLATDPGSYNIYNGAMTEFDNAYNVELYAALNSGALLPEADAFGSQSVIDSALGGDATVMSAFDTFLQAGFSDLVAYLF